MKKHLWWIIGISIATILCYSNIFTNGFFGDDFDFVINWEDARDFSKLGELLKGAVPANHWGVYRPLRSVLYIVDYQLWGLDPWGYHLHALLVHLSVTLLTYLLIYTITQKRFLAGGTALLFGVHPIHTEAITHIAAAIDQTAIVFMLVSMYGFLYAGKKKWVYPLSIVSALCAYFTNEMTLTLPLVLMLYDIVFQKITRANWKSRIKKHIPYFVGVGAYLFIRFALASTPLRADYLAGSFYLTMLTMVKVFFRYVTLMIIPHGLNHNPTIAEGVFAFEKEINVNAIRAQSLFDVDILIPLLIMGALIGIAFWKYKKFPLYAFGIGMFFITLAPVSQVIPLAQLIAERYTYIGSIGGCLAIVYTLQLLHKKLPKAHASAITMIILCAIAGVYGLGTYERNKDWHSPITLWKDTVEKSPTSQIAHNNLGIAYMNDKQLDLALQHYTTALRLNPNSPKTHNNVGIVWAMQGKWEEAIVAYSRAIELSEDYPRAYYNLAVAYKKTGQDERAAAIMKKVKHIDSRYADANTQKVSEYITQLP